MKQRSMHFSVSALILILCLPAIFNAAVVGAQGEETLGWKLVGTAVADDPSKNFAILENQSTGNQKAYREGDRVGDLLIKKILPGSAIVGTRMGDQVLSMSSGRSAGNVESSPQAAQLDRKEVDAVLPEYMQLMREIRIRPHFEAGKPAGFYVTRIEPDSIFAKMGLEDGDVIIGVNGKPIATTMQAKEFYQALRVGGTISLEIERENSKKVLHFVIE